MKPVLIIFLFLFCFKSSFSQRDKRIDSLILFLKSDDLSQREKAIALNELAYIHQDLDTTLYLAKQSLSISKRIDDLVLQGEALEEISHIERRLGNNSKSLQAALKALQIYESLDLVERQAASYNQLASNNMIDEKYDLAIKYLNKAKGIYSKSDKLANKVFSILNLGEAYRLAGNLDSAVIHFNEALKLNVTIKNKIVFGYSKGNLGMVYTTQNKLQEAKSNLNDAITTLKPLGDAYSTSVYIAELGKIHSKENQFKLAEAKFIEALSMAKQAGLKEQIRDFSALLTNFYEDQKQYVKALEYQKLFQVYQDSLVNKANVQKIEQIKAGFEIDKRESEIDVLHIKNTHQKYWVIGLVSGSTILLLFVYLLYKGNKKIKKANNTLSQQKIIITKREEEKTLLLRELNHRIKNNLQMISSLLNLQSNELTGHPAKEALVAGKQRVEALSLVHSKLYQEDLDTKIELKDYMEELVLGLFHGFDASFKPHLDIDHSSINLDTAIPLALIINELVINALKYAFTTIEKPELKLVMLQHNNNLDIEVIDNGIGFNMDEVERNNSFGIKLIYTLIEQLQGVIKKVDSKKGTHWHMSLNSN